MKKNQIGESRLGGWKPPNHTEDIFHGNCICSLILRSPMGCSLVVNHSLTQEIHRCFSPRI